MNCGHCAVNFQDWMALKPPVISSSFAFPRSLFCHYGVIRKRSKSHDPDDVSNAH